MSRRPVNPTRRIVGNGGFPLAGAFPSKTHSSPLLSITLVLLVLLLHVAQFICLNSFTVSISNVKSLSDDAYRFCAIHLFVLRDGMELLGIIISRHSLLFAARRVYSLLLGICIVVQVYIKPPTINSST